MTDNEIIKALECCAVEGNCGECPMKHKELDDMCVRVNIRNVISLINRQKAEIERLKDDVECFAEISMAYQKYFFEGEIEGLEKHFRAEAVKEFAERLKANIIHKSYPLKLSAVGEIDNLVKEFTVGDNA